jgi:hypothetical protein
MSGSADLDHLDMEKIRGHYESRLEISERLKQFHNQQEFKSFAELTLGITSDGQGNYSARDHALGPQILSNTSPKDIYILASDLIDLDDPREMLRTIYDRNIPYLKVSVGSEIAMMMKPQTFWVANTRSVWAHLLVKHNFNYRIANEELSLYRDDEEESEMHYRKWREICLVMKQTLVELGKRGDKQASKQRMQVGKIRNIWHDAIANALYEERFGSD